MANKGIIKQLLMSNNYWVLNKEMVKLFGLEAAFLLSNFAEAETLMADDEGWFYQTSDTVESMTTLSRHKQDQAVKALEKTGVLEKSVRGLPPKRYFRINYECLTNLFVKNQQINMSRIDKSICKKSATNKELSNKELSNKEHDNKAEASLEAEKKSFDYKKVLELYAEHCKELPQVRALTDNRKKTLKSWGNLEEIEEVFKKAGKSKFLAGVNDRKWKANFDWIINQTNRVKILEDAYIDKEVKEAPKERKLRSAEDILKEFNSQ
jgi:hypothetical protein